MNKKWLTHFSVLLVVFSILSCGVLTAEELLSPEKAVALDPNVLWTSTSWAGNNDTKSVSLDDSGDFPKFTVAEANRRHVWTYYFTIPFDPNRYPIAVMTYRARNTNPRAALTAYGSTTRPGRTGITSVLSAARNSSPTEKSTNFERICAP